MKVLILRKGELPGSKFYNLLKEYNTYCPLISKNDLNGYDYLVKDIDFEMYNVIIFSNK